MEKECEHAMAVSRSTSKAFILYNGMKKKKKKTCGAFSRYANTIKRVTFLFLFHHLCMKVNNEVYD